MGKRNQCSLEGTEGQAGILRALLKVDSVAGIY